VQKFCNNSTLILSLLKRQNEKQRGNEKYEDIVKDTSLATGGSFGEGTDV